MVACGTTGDMVTQRMTGNEYDKKERIGYHNTKGHLIWPVQVKGFSDNLVRRW